MKIVYQNEMYKVLYMDFGCGFGKLYGIFRKDEKELTRSTACSGRRDKADAIKVADYLQAGNKWKKEANS